MRVYKTKGTKGTNYIAPAAGGYLVMRMEML
jgi:hypothetical protein